MTFEEFQRIRKLYGGLGGPRGAGEVAAPPSVEVRARGPVGGAPTPAPRVSAPGPPAVLFPTVRPISPVPGQVATFGLPATTSAVMPWEVESRLPSGQRVGVFNLPYGLLPGSQQLIPQAAPVGNQITGLMQVVDPYVSQRIAAANAAISNYAGTIDGVPVNENDIPIVTGATGTTAEMLGPTTGPQEPWSIANALQLAMAAGGQVANWVAPVAGAVWGATPETAREALTWAGEKGLDWMTAPAAWNEERHAEMMYRTAKEGTAQELDLKGIPFVMAGGPSRRYLQPGEPGYEPGKMIDDPGRFNAWALEHPLDVISAYENGYQPASGAYAGQTLTGERAVWELYINQQDAKTRAALALLMDPSTPATLLAGGAPTLGLAAERAALAGRPWLARGLRAAELGIRLPEDIIELPVTGPLRAATEAAPVVGGWATRLGGAIEGRYPAFGGAARRAADIAGRPGRWAVAPTPETTATDFSQRYPGELAEIQAAQARVEQLGPVRRGPGDEGPPGGGGGPGPGPDEGPPTGPVTPTGGAEVVPTTGVVVAGGPEAAGRPAPTATTRNGFTITEEPGRGWIIRDPTGRFYAGTLSEEDARRFANNIDPTPGLVPEAPPSQIPQPPEVTTTPAVPLPAVEVPFGQPGWAISRMNLADVAAGDPAQQQRLMQALLPHETTLTQELARRDISDLDKAIAEGQFRAQAQIALANERIAMPAWRLRFTDEPATRRNIGAADEAFPFETVETLPSGQLVAVGESPQKRVERLIDERDWESRASKDDRYALRRTRMLQSRPPDPDLAARIANANLKRDTLTITMPNGDSRTFSNAQLRAMSPAERAQIADLAVAQQTAAYQRELAVRDVHTRLHGQVAEVPLPVAAVPEPGVGVMPAAGPGVETVPVPSPVPAAPAVVAPERQRQLLAEELRQATELENLQINRINNLSSQRGRGGQVQQARAELARIRAAKQQIEAELRALEAGPAPAVTPARAVPAAPEVQAELPSAEPARPISAVDPETGKPLAVVDGEPSRLVHEDGTLTPHGLRMRQTELEKSLRRADRALKRAQKGGNPERIADAQAHYDRTKAIFDQARQQLLDGSPVPAASPGAGSLYFVDPASRRVAEFFGPTTRTSAIPTARPAGDALDDLVNMGEISPQAADDYKQYVVYEGEQLRLIDVYDRMKAFIEDAQPELSPSQVNEETTKRFFGYANEKLRPETPSPTVLGQAIDTLNENARAGIMYNIVTGLRGIFGDWIGDNWLSSLTHGFDVFPAMNDPRLIAAAEQFVHGGRDLMLKALKPVQFINDLGITELPRSIVNVKGARGEVTADLMPIARGLTKIPGFRAGPGYWFARVLAEVPQSHLLRATRTGLDLARRVGLYTHVVRREFPAAANRFRRLLTTEADRLGYDANELWNGIMAQAQARVEGAGRTWNRQFMATDVTAALRELGITDTSLSAAWGAEVRGLNEAGQAAVNKSLFSYRQTNLDKQLSRGIMFNYWQSRALVAHTRLILNHPIVGLNYLRAYQGMQREAERQGYPESVRGWLAFMGDKGGWWGFFDPISMLTPYSMFRESAPRADQRAWEKFGQKYRLFFSPPLQAAANMFGYGTSAVDPTGTYSVRTAVINVINYDRNHGNHLGLGPGITEDEIDTFVQGVFHTASEIAEKSPLPFAEEIDETNPQATEIAQVNNIILSMQEDKYGPIESWDQYEQTDANGFVTNPVMAETLEAENAVRLDRAEGNPIAEEALAKWSGQGLKGQGWRMAIPGGFRQIYMPQQQLREEAEAGYAALEAGVEPSAAEQAAMTQQQLITAGSAEGANLAAEQALYEGLGTERQQAAKDRYNQIVNLTLDPNDRISVPGPHGQEVYGLQDLKYLDKAKRQEIAERWIANFGATAELEQLRSQQDVQRAGSPELDRFKTWQADAYDYAEKHGGMPAFRKEMSRVSPSYRAYIDGLPADLTPAELDRKSVSADAWLAYSGQPQTIYDVGTPPRTDISEAEPGQFIPGFGAEEGDGGGGGRVSDVQYLENELLDWQLDYQQYQQGVFALTGGQPIDQPIFKEALANELRVAGITEPRMPAVVSAYFAWVRLQPQGADVSPAAYIAWRDAEKAKLTQQFYSSGAYTSPYYLPNQQSTATAYP